MADQATATIYQYFKDLDVPVFVKLDSAEFSTEFVITLEKMGFVKLTTEEAQQVEEVMVDNLHSRLLHISQASPSVLRQIEMVVESDRFGKESLIPKTGYKVYRYKGEALLVFSMAAREWQMGVDTDFGSGHDSQATKTVLNRFLSWALAPLGILGFWGVPVDEGAVLLKQGVSQGEVVYFDVLRSKILCEDGQRALSPKTWIIKLDNKLKDRNVPIGQEDFYSALSLHCSFFEYEKYPVHVRQLIRTVCQKTSGMYYPVENFKPRTDLSIS